MYFVRSFPILHHRSLGGSEGARKVIGICRSDGYESRLIGCHVDDDDDCFAPRISRKEEKGRIEFRSSCHDQHVRSRTQVCYVEGLAHWKRNHNPIRSKAVKRLKVFPAFSLIVFVLGCDSIQSVPRHFRHEQQNPDCLKFHISSHSVTHAILSNCQRWMSTHHNDMVPSNLVRIPVLGQFHNRCPVRATFMAFYDPPRLALAPANRVIEAASKTEQKRGKCGERKAKRERKMREKEKEEKARLTGMVLVRNISMHHEMRFVISMRINVDRLMITVGHMQPDGAAQRINLCFPAPR